MTLEILLFIVLLAAFCCYIVYRWQEAVVNKVLDEQAPEAYPVPHEELDPTPLNPQAAWPFPRGPKP